MSDDWEQLAGPVISGIPHVALVGKLGGDKALVLTPDPAAPMFVGLPEVQHALVGRMRCYVDGRCPDCGAVWSYPNRAMRRAMTQRGEVVHGSMLHEHDCSVSDDAIQALVAARNN
jgi:hypothetical protein